MSIMIAPLPPAARALAELPRHKLEMLAEVIVAILDATEPDRDLEPEHDRCEALEDRLEATIWDGATGPGDEADAEDDDPRERDDEDRCDADDDRIEGAPISHASDDEDREPEPEGDSNVVYFRSVRI